MSASKSWPVLLLASVAILAAEESFPTTVCESSRAVRVSLFTTYIEQGDVHASAGQIAEAASLYLKVFRPFQHDGDSYGPARCAEAHIYQDAANKLRVVAIPYAARIMARGYYETAPKNDDLRGGALYLLLESNSYDAFINNSLEYAASELHERDIDGYLQGLVDARLKWLSQVADALVWDKSGLINDTVPLLDEEQAAFLKLSGFPERLSAHLKPLYPKITDHWLSEETRWHDKLPGFNRDIGHSLLDIRQSTVLASATGAIGQGLVRLSDHPREVKRLKDRANARGHAFMLQEKYWLARDYFEVAGNDERWAQVDKIVKRDEQERLLEFEAAARTDIEKMRKTDAEKSAFEDEADDMAEEFGFDLED